MVEVNNQTTRSSLYALAQSPDARKALALCLLYFPELVTAANDYILSQSAYYIHLVTHFNEEQYGNTVGQAGAHQGFQETLEGLNQAKNALDNIIVMMASKYGKV